MPTSPPQPPIPPPNLPPGRVVDLPGRGEVFVREQPASRPGQPTIVLLHGWTATADLNWFRAYEAVAAFGHVIAIDHRGHGRGLRTEERFTLEDAADDVGALLRILEPPRPAIVVGYSMGGPIAMLLWRRHPDLVDGLVLQATALEWNATRRERFVWRFMGGLEFFLRIGRPRGVLDRAFRRAVDRRPDLASLHGWLRAELRRGDPAALADAGRALAGYDGREFASQVDVPTAVVVTTRDRLVRPRKQRALADAIPGATTFDLVADHDACLIEPEAFVRQTTAALYAVRDRLTLSSTRTAG